ncbi:MAG: hypothetical protein KAX37_07805 [Opitutaceae bacterium]|nr:hypothetical protein [Opitutaceae bacterium]
METKAFHHSDRKAQFVQVTTVVKFKDALVERFHWDETTLVDLEPLEGADRR